MKYAIYNYRRYVNRKINLSKSSIYNTYYINPYHITIFNVSSLKFFVPNL